MAYTGEPSDNFSDVNLKNNDECQEAKESLGADGRIIVGVGQIRGVLHA
jgi:hypothetical protein